MKNSIVLLIILLFYLLPMMSYAQFGSDFESNPYPPALIDPYFPMTPIGDPAYWIADDMCAMQGFSPCSGDGNFLIIDSDHNGQGAIIFQEYLPGVTGSEVNFQFDALHRFEEGQSNSTLFFWLEINGVPQETFQLEERNGCDWTSFSTCIDLPENTIIYTYALVQQGISHNYDYGIDNIAFDIDNSSLQNEFIIVDNEGNQKDPFCNPERLFLEEIKIVDEVRYKIDIRKTQFCPFEPFLDPIIDWRTTGWVNGQVSSPLELTNLWAPSPFNPGAFEVKLTVEDACGNQLEYIQFICITECFVEIVGINVTPDPDDPCIYCYEPIINVSDCVEEIRYSWSLDGEGYRSEQNPCITFCSDDLAEVQFRVEIWSEDPQTSLPCDFDSHIDTIIPEGCEGCEVINQGFGVGADQNCENILINIQPAITNSCTELIAYEIWWAEDDVQVVVQHIDPIVGLTWDLSHSHEYIPKEGREICVVAIGEIPNGETCRSEFCWSGDLPCDPCPCSVQAPEFDYTDNEGCTKFFVFEDPITNSCTEIADLQISWGDGEFDGGNVHTFPNNGIFEVCVRVEGSADGGESFCEDEYCQEVQIFGCNDPDRDDESLSPIKGKEVSTLILDINLQPNPANHQVTISLADRKSGIERLTIYNINGQLIEHQQNLGNHQIKMDVSNYAEGLYMIEIIDQEGHRSIEKLIVK